MNSLFQFCQELEYLNLTNFNTSMVNDMQWMFNQCTKIKDIKGINNFNTLNVSTMRGMFYGCGKLEYLDLSNLDTSNVTDMGCMFEFCYKLKEIKGINNFKTSQVEYMDSMFMECIELEFLDLSNFNYCSIIDMSWMFKRCNKLIEIKGIEKFKLFKDTDQYDIFSECYKLKDIDISIFIDRGKQDDKNERPKEIKFSSSDQIIQYTTYCFKKDNFSKIEKELFDKFPELRFKNIVFLAGGCLVNTSMTLEQNKIKKNTTIIIHYMDIE